jgi:predicted ArsR family transcriptional regulator
MSGLAEIDRQSRLSSEASMRGGRPPGEIRTAIVVALEARGPMSLRDIAHRALIGVDATRRTLDHLVRAEVIEIVGREKRAHCKKWVALYDLVRKSEDAAPEMSPTEELAAVLSLWCR